MSDYIEREALLKRKPFTYAGGYLSSYNSGFLDCAEEARETIKNAPAADVAPVVRCSQCVQHEDNGYHFCNKWEHFLPDDSEFFCAFGERKEDNT